VSHHGVGRRSVTPELDHLLGERQWFTDADGGAVCRSELVERLAEELDMSATLLIERLRADPRKSISIPKIIELIEDVLEP
jgi:hypothetical protein